MTKPVRIALSALLATALFGSTLAQADDVLDEYNKDTWPLEVTKRPLTLAKGMLEIRGDTFMFNLSKDAVGKPFSLAPDIYYGVDSKLSVGLTHGGLFTQAGSGICLAGEDNQCPQVYDNFGIEALYGLMLGGSFQVALRGGFVSPQISDDFGGGLKIGALGRLQTGNIAIVFDPGLYVEIIDRDTREQFVNIPVWVQFQVNTQTVAFVSTGMYGPLSDFGDNYLIPLGVGATMAANNRIDFGAEFQLPMLAGNRPDGIDAFDARQLIVRAALRL
jgi:hypothetical protein